MADVKIKITAQDQASRVLDQVRGSLGQVQSVAATVGSALGLIGVGSVAGLAAMMKATINSLDALNDLSDATGSSIENISALEDTAARTGTSMDTVSTALVKFNKVLTEAKPGSDAEAALSALNLSVKELKALDPAEALLKTAIALAGFADDGNKARIIQTLFGKSIKEVAALLKDLAEKGKLVATVTTEQAQEAEKFNKELFNMQKNVSDLSREIAGPLISAFNNFLAKQREAKAQGKFGLFTSPIQAELDYNSGMRTGSWYQGNAGRGGINPDRVKPSLPESIGGKTKAEKTTAEHLSDTQQALASYVTGLQRTIDSTSKLSAEQEALNFLMGLGTAGEVAQVRELVLGLAARADALKLQAEAQKLAESHVITMAKEQLAMSESNTKLREQMQEIGLTKDALNKLILARQDDAIATQEQNLALLRGQSGQEADISQLEATIALLKEKRTLTAGGQIAQAAADVKKDSDQASKDYAKELHDDVKGALSTAFRDTNDPIAAFGDALGNVIFTRVTNSLAEALATQLLGDGKDGLVGGLIGSLISFDGGGYTGGGLRSGGLDGKGGFLSVLHPNETVLDHSKGQTGGGNVTVVQNFTVGDVASVSMVRQAVAGSERRITAGIGRSMNYGGALG